MAAVSEKPVCDMPEPDFPPTVWREAFELAEHIGTYKRVIWQYNHPSWTDNQWRDMNAEVSEELENTYRRGVLSANATHTHTCALSLSLSLSLFPPFSGALSFFPSPPLALRLSLSLSRSVSLSLSLPRSLLFGGFDESTLEVGDSRVTVTFETMKQYSRTHKVTRGVRRVLIARPRNPECDVD